MFVHMEITGLNRGARRPGRYNRCKIEDGLRPVGPSYYINTASGGTGFPAWTNTSAAGAYMGTNSIFINSRITIFILYLQILD
jgi:hypothetical protein